MAKKQPGTGTFDKIMAAMSSKKLPKELEKPAVEIKDKGPSAGWRTTTMMADEFVGDSAQHKRKLLKLIDRKTEEFKAAAQTKEQIEKTIHNEWVRECVVGIMGAKILCASEKAITELLRDGDLELKKKIPLKPDGWISNCSDAYRGDTEKRKKIYLEFAEEKKQELVKNEGKTARESDKIVYEKWVGIYSNVNQPALCISPDGAKILEERGLLVKRDKNKILKKDKAFVNIVGSTSISPESVKESINQSKGANL